MCVEIIFLVFLPTVVTFFELKMCMYCHGFILCFFFTSKFSSLYFFLSLIILFPQDCHKSIPKSTANEKNLYNSICGNFLPELTPRLVRWFMLKNSTRSCFPQSVVFQVGGSHYITLVTNTEQYNKGAKWI